MGGNAGETPSMDTLQAEKVDALQSEPSIEEVVQGNTVQGSNSPRKWGIRVVSQGRWVASRTARKRTGHSKLRGGE